MKSIRLLVAQLVEDDINKGIVRVDSSFMQQINVKEGDMVEIKGKRNTFAKVYRHYPGDAELRIVRMDCKAEIGSNVTVRKASVKNDKPKEGN